MSSLVRPVAEKFSSVTWACVGRREAKRSGDEIEDKAKSNYATK